MNRISIITAAAFATLTGCAEGYDQVNADALSIGSFAGIQRSVTLAPWDAIESFPNDESTSDSTWLPADLPIGNYWMTINAVDAIKGGADLEVGMRHLTYITSVDGVPMLKGFAPIFANGDDLRADRVDSYTAPQEDGRCEVTSLLSAEGYRGGPDVFKMTVEVGDTITGEDCYKLGFGEEKSEFVSVDATFEFIRPVGDEPKDENDEKPFQKPGNDSGQN